MRGWALCGAVLAACAGQPVRRAATPPPLEVKAYPPLGFAADATTPGLAVVLGTDPRGGSSVFRLAGAARPVVVALVGDPPGGTEGKPGGPVTVSATPSRDGAVELHATPAPPPEAQLAISLAAWAAAAALGKEVSELAFTVEPAGALTAEWSAALATGFVASALGWGAPTIAARPGIIQVDGTIALTVADQLEVSPLLEAGAGASGGLLPATVPVDAAEMAMDAAASSAFEQEFRQRQRALAAIWPALLQLGNQAPLPGSIRHLADLAQTEARAAESLRQAGDLPAACDGLEATWAYASAATRGWDLLSSTAHDPAAAAAELAKLTAAPTELTAPPLPATASVGQFLGALDALDLLVRASARRTVAAQGVAEMTRLLGEDRAAEAADPMSAALVAVGRVEAEAHRAASEPKAGPAVTATLPALRRLARSYQPVAVANLGWLDTTAAPGPAFAATQRRLAEGGAAVELARITWGGDSVAAALAAVSAAELAFFHSTVAVSHGRALGVTVDAITGEPTDASVAASLPALLDAAEVSARRHARAAQIAVGVIPLEARRSYLVAQARRGGDVGDKLHALELYWRSAAVSRRAVMVARR